MSVPPHRVCVSALPQVGFREVKDSMVVPHMSLVLGEHTPTAVFKLILSVPILKSYL